ncbi:MAG: inosine monophosphate cyclohydrolase [Clostridiales bacterium]|nr:inosine monophosphate cyclohydrolase [Clostridiales bacterium]
MNSIVKLLKQNSYPGRGIVIGKSKDESKAIFAYFIMGRSPNSRNRIFVEKDNEVIILPFDSKKVSDPSLIIYSPIKQLGNFVIVTNGDQTDTVQEYLQQGKTMEDALSTRLYEPDCPNFTPRISGLIHFDNNNFNYKLSILKCANNDGKECQRHFYNYQSKKGAGHFIHTYKNDGNPLPSFSGEPVMVEILDDIDLFANNIWNALNDENKISLYVKYIDIATKTSQARLFNKNN